MPYATIATMAAIICVFLFTVYCLEWKRRDTWRRRQRLVHRNILKQTGSRS